MAEMKMKREDVKGGKPAKEARRVKDRKFKDIKKTRTSTEFLVRGKNNIEWRTGDKMFTKLVASLPFGNPSGLVSEIDYNMEPSGGTPAVLPHTIPGILAIITKITIGSGRAADVYNSPFNLAIRKIYSYVRHANSGSKNYEAADLGMYIVAVGQALGLLGFAQRILALINCYSPTNRYTPKYLIDAMGFDYEDFIVNQAQLKYLIAWMGRAIGALAFPDMPYFRACYEAYKWVYRDNDSPKEQFYVNIPADFGVYDPTLTTTGGGVKWNTTAPHGPGVNAGMPFAQFANFVHKVLDVLLSDEDIGIMSGDILKAYRDGGLFVPEAFGDYDPFVKDDEALQQFHNASIVDPDYLDLDQIQQLPGGTNQAPYIIPHHTSATACADRQGVGHNLFIDAFSKVPEAEEVVNCAVFNVQYQKVTASSTSPTYVDKPLYDLFLPVGVVLIRKPGTAVNLTKKLFRTSEGITFALSGSEFDLTNCDWHPVKIMLNSSGTEIIILGDLQNARFFDYNVANRIHEASMLNLLAYSKSNFSEKI